VRAGVGMASRGGASFCASGTGAGALTIGVGIDVGIDAAAGAVGAAAGTGVPSTLDDGRMLGAGGA
jgi:hypothetical protein